MKNHSYQTFILRDLASYTNYREKLSKDNLVVTENSYNIINKRHLGWFKSHLSLKI